MSQAPTIAYPGGKARHAKEIISFLPKHGRTYLEPFAGRGNLFWAAACAGLQYDKWWLNDTVTAPYFRAIKEIGDTIEVPECSRYEYERQRGAFKSGDQTAALLEPFLSFGGAGYLHSGFRGTRQGGVSADGYQKTLRTCHEIIRRTRPRISSLDWKDMGLEGLGKQDVVVIDAPYPNTNLRSYTAETVDYFALVDLLLSAKFRWVLCGYIHPALHRLGEPAWAAADVRFLYFPPTGKGKRYGEERRIECLWTNYAPDKGVRRYPLPTAVRARIQVQTDAASLSFTALDAKIDDGLQTVARDWNAVVPFLLEMHRRLSAPGKRTDLRKGVPSGLTWTAWVETKRHKLGRSLRTIQYMLKGKTEASRDRQMLLAQPHAGLRSEPEWSIPDTPMEIATQISRLVLEMRDADRNEKQRKQRLELLAEHFLRITGQDRESDSIDSIDIGKRTPGGVNLTM